MKIRAAEEADVDPLARLWHDGWQDAHAAILPPELARHRMLESFAHRLRSDLDNARVIGPREHPLGFCIARDGELYQLYVAADARGTGVAAALLADAEDRLRAQGTGTGWLACAIGNERVAKFYEKHGWRRVGDMVSVLPTPDGPFRLDVWRHEKDLHAARPGVGVAHVVLETDDMDGSCRFMRIVGMRPVFDGPEVSVYELRGGTHLILMRRDAVAQGNATFDLMVDDLHASHARFQAAGLDPSPIEARPAIDHEAFTLREPAGHVITVFSSHASGKPV